MQQNAFSVEVEILDSEVRAMYEAVEQAERELKTLMDAIEVLNSSWTGPSNMTFRRAFRRDYEATTEGCKELKRQVQTVEEAGSKYRACEASVLQRVQRL